MNQLGNVPLCNPCSILDVVYIQGFLGLGQNEARMIKSYVGRLSKEERKRHSESFSKPKCSSRKTRRAEILRKVGA